MLTTLQVCASFCQLLQNLATFLFYFIAEFSLVYFAYADGFMAKFTGPVYS